MNNLSLTVTLLVLSLFQMSAQKVYIEDNKFQVNGQPLHLNGANTPWNSWNDFGRDFNYEWWNNHFAELHEAGINSTRVWLSCDPNHSAMLMDDNGRLNGITEAFWKDLDSLMSIAQKHKVYVMGALISFDHFSTVHGTSGKWAKMLKSEENIDLFAENYAVPLVKRYKDNPYFFSIDVCNEIIWVSESENSSVNAVPWSNIQYFVGKVAQRVHETSDLLVCTSNYMKFTSPNYSGNRYSDKKLKEAVGDEDAYLDFYKIHYYTWVSKWQGGFHPIKTPTDFLIDDKPCITGEMPGNEIYAYSREEDKNVWLMGIKEAYEVGYQNGWQGSMPWTSNSVDEYGSLANNIAEATIAFRDKHYDLVYPDLSEQYLSVNKSNIEISKDEISVGFEIAANVPWTINSDATWVEITEMQGQGDAHVILNLHPKNMGQNESAVIEISSSKGVKTINIIQASTLVNNIIETPHLKSEGVSIYPNPFMGTFTMDYTLEKNTHVKIELIGIGGQLLKVVTNQYQTSGKHSVSINGNNCETGLLFLRISCQDGSQSSFSLIKI